MKKSILELKEIVIDNKIYPRDSVSNLIVNRYRSDMKKGDVFPALYVALFRKKYYLVDGRHRFEAMSLLGEKHIQCEIKENFIDFNEMFLASIRSNLRHGHQLNKADKMKIAYTLKDMEYDTDEISKITGLDLGYLERNIANSMSRTSVIEQVKDKRLPEKLKFKEPESKDSEIAVVNIEGKILTTKELKDDNDIAQLNEIYKFLKYRNFNRKNEKISELLFKIDKLKVWRGKRE